MENQIEIFRLDELESMGTRALLVIAKELEICKRHDMKKTELIMAIMGKQLELLKPVQVDEVEPEQPASDEVIPEVQEAIKELPEELQEAIQEAADEVQAADAEAKILSFEDAIEQAIKRVEIKAERDPEAAKEIKRRYARTVALETIVAFKVGNKMYSGKIIEIHLDKFRVETKRGVRFLIDKEAVAWFKTGDRWPRGVYNELIKGVNAND